MRAEELLADVAWLRQLARRLVADEAVARDLVQETWIAAAHKAPEARDSRRPWRRKVLRDLWRMRLRGERRRGAREEQSVAFVDGVPTPEELVARADDHELTRPSETTVEAAAAGEPLVLALEPTARLEGVVTSAGRPLAGARVRLAPAGLPRYFGDAPGRAEATSDRDGRFALGGARSGREYAIQVRDQIVVAPVGPIAIDRPLVSGVAVEVASGAVVAGVVHDGAGGPAARARIIATSGGPSRSVVADEQGRFRIAGLIAGHVSLRATAADGTGASGLIELSLAADQRRDDLDLVLDRGAFVAGVVVDERGRPVEDVEVTTTGPVGTMDVAMAVTTAEGRFELGPLAGGTAYTLHVHPYRGGRTDLAPASGQPFAPIAVADGGARVDGVQLAVRLDASDLAGVVVDGNGKPLADVTVRASPEPQPGVAYDLGTQTPWPAARSGADGSFRVAVRGAATYTLEAQPSYDAPARRGGVAAGARDVELRVVAPGAITGILRGFDDRAVVTASVGEVRHVARVADGSFTIDGLGAGRYELVALDGARRTASAQLDVRTGALARVELTAAAPGRVHGRAAWADGTPAPGLRCIAHPLLTRGAWSWPSLAVVTTGADGGFAFGELPVSQVMIRCGVDPYFGAGGTAFALVEAGGDVEAQMTIREGQR